MDRILRIKREKQSGDLYELIQSKNYIYIWGRSGIGKSYAVEKAYPHAINLESNILKSKQTTIEFLDRIKGSGEAVLIDDYESVSDLIGIREIEGVISRGPLIIIGHSATPPNGKPFVYKFPQMSPTEIEKLLKCPESSRASVECDGDIRYFFNMCLHASSKKDEFMSAKDVIHSLVHVDGTRSAANMIGEYLDEHGNMLGMIQENYINAPMVDMVLVSESLSRADVIDSVIYDGSWDSMCFFYNEAILIPAQIIGHSLTEIKTASIWTKSLNIRMRQKKIRDINSKNKHTPLDHDALVLIGRCCNSDLVRAQELINDYNLDPADLDVINHLVKIKTKHLTILKKRCREKTKTV